MIRAPQDQRSSKRRARRSRRRGQAMVEYSVINAILVLFLMLGSSLRVVPSPFPNSNNKMNVIEVMLWAYHVYYDGIYLVLNSPYP